MDAAHSQQWSRISRMLFAALGVAFAWVVLSVAFGLSTSHAHADDDGLLGAVTSTVEGTASTATGVVEDTATAAAQTVAPVVAPVSPLVQTVTEIVPVAPVAQTVTEIVPVAPVVDAVESTVAPVVAPVISTVTAVTESGVVSPIVESTLGIVDSVPVVGGVVSAIGADDAVSALGSSVDGVVTGTAGAVIGTASTVVDVVAPVVGVTPTTPLIPAGEPLTASDSATAVLSASTTSDAAAGPLQMLARAASLVGATAVLAIVPDLPAAFSTTDVASAVGGVAGGVFSLLRSVMQADSVLIGPGGAGPGAWVLVALGFVVAYRAWVRRTGLENDVAPAAPVLSTDVSPD